MCYFFTRLQTKLNGAFFKLFYHFWDKENKNHARYAHLSLYQTPQYENAHLIPF